MANQNTAIYDAIDALGSLGVNDVQHSWTDQYHEGGFCEFFGLPPFLQEDAGRKKYFTDGLSQLGVSLEKVLEDVKNTDEAHASVGENLCQDFWQSLLDSGHSHKAVVAVLASFIGLTEKGCKVGYKLLSSVLAAKAYHLLVCIPGSQAYNVFHPVLFERSVDVLKFWPPKDGEVRKPKQKPAIPKRKGRGRGGAKRNRRGAPVSQPTESDEELESEEDIEIEEENNGDVLGDVCESLLSFMKTVCRLLQVFSLKNAEDACFHLIQTLVFLTRQEDPISFNRYNTGGEISSLAFTGLEVICKAVHGNTGQISRKICECLMPNLLMLTGDKGGSIYSGAIPKAAFILRDKTLDFIKKLCAMGDQAFTSAVRVLIQHLASNVPDRAEYRAAVAQTLCSILKELPPNEQCMSVDWLQKLSKSAKISARVFALESISALMGMSSEETPLLRKESVPNISANVNSQDLQDTVGAVNEVGCGAGIKGVLLQTIISRCSDRAPTVRSKALHCVQLASSTLDPGFLGAVREALFAPLGDLGVTPVVDDSGDGMQRTRDPLSSTVISTIRKRTMDAKVLVRKTALQALESAVKLNPSGVEDEDLKILEERCMDEALSVRKQAIISLTEVLKIAPSNTSLQRAWLNAVLPSVIDKETTMQEKCCLLLEDAILHGINDEQRDEGEAGQLAWSLMAVIAGDNGQELSQYLAKVCEVWNKQGKFTRTLVKNLLTHLASQHSKSAWLLLAEIAVHFNQIDKSVVLNAWRQASSNDGSNYMTIARILKVLGLIASKLTSTERSEVLGKLKAGICDCECPPEIVSSSVACISKLSNASGDDGVSLKEWCESVMSICEKIVTDSVLGTENDCAMDENQVTRSLFTLGEVAQLCPAKTSARMFVMVQSFLFSEKKDQTGNSQSSASSNLGSDLTLNKNLAPVIRAHAFVTLGKLCLQNEDLAKSCIAAIARELEISEDPVVRNNVIVLLCDLCVRYTNLVDRYVPNIASCLKDPDPLVRRQTLTLLTQLLSEDFVKWRGSLFFKFVMAVVDENEEIRKFSEFCLVNLLLLRHPNMFSHHFVECIFFFNSYEKHKVYNQFFQTENEKKRFSLKGDANYRKRLQLYKFLLNHMNDEQKFNLTGKLCHEVLGSVIDGDMEIDHESGQIIRDALAILGSKDIKLSSLKSRPVDTEEDGLNEQQDAAAQAVATARAKIITQVVKRNMIENIIPIIVALKHELEKRMSPLVRYLMRCLAEIVKDYRSEVQDVLATDRQLANEIEYDIKRFEERQKELAQDGRDGPLLAALGQSPLYSPSGRGVIASEEGQPFLTPRLKVRRNEASLTPTRQTGLQEGRRSVFETRKQPLLTAALINSARKAMENSRRSCCISTTPARNGLRSENREETSSGNTQQENVTDAASDLARMSVGTSAPKPNDQPMAISARPLPILPGRVARDLLSKSKASASETESDNAEERGGARGNEPQTSDLELSKDRVASTPEVDRTNPGQFTFLADLSVIMNSPVPAFVVPKGARKNSRVAKREPKSIEDQIICLPSPEKGVLQRKVWNVQSPLQKPVTKELKRETTQLRKRRSSRRRKK